MSGRTVGVRLNIQSNLSIAPPKDWPKCAGDRYTEVAVKQV